METPKRAGKMLDRKLRQAEADCYNDIAEAIRNHFPGIEITGAQVAGRVAELLKAEARLQESDCTSCGHAAMCPYNSTRYCVARINCPSYRPKV